MLYLMNSSSFFWLIISEISNAYHNNGLQIIYLCMFVLFLVGDSKLGIVS